MKTSRLLLAAAVALSGFAVAQSPASAKEWKTINFGTEAGYEPWNLTKPDGTIDGFEIELTRDICAKLDVKCNFITTDWDGAITALAAGKFDVLVDALSITDERKKVIDFSAPYANTPASFVGLKTGDMKDMPGTGTTIHLGADGTGDDAMLDKLRAALKGKTIAVQTATTFADFAHKHFDDVATVREYKTAAEHDLDVMTGRADVAFDDATVEGAALAKPDNKDLTVVGPLIAGQVWGDGMAYGVAKSNPELRDMLTKGVEQALADGTVKKLSQKWFNGLDVTP